MGVPIVDTYRYLGTRIDTTFSSVPQVTDSNKAIELAFSALYPLLSKKNLKFNINSFICYALPRILLIPINTNLEIKREKE